MSADIDSSCQSCGFDPCIFKTEKLTGHSKRHRTAKCPKCKEFDILSRCNGC